MTNTPTLLPNWPDFERDYVQGGVPHLFVVRNDPVVAVFIDQGAERIGARFETATTRAEGQAVILAEIHVDDVVREGRRALEIWTDAAHLFANFYELVCEIIGSVVDDGAEPDAALADAVTRWDALLSRPSLMSEEAQAGLFGELWLLERLIGSLGVEAVDAWVGPVRQPHDFRLGHIELEVKTTSGAARVHTINGAGQLQPSVDCALHLLSIKLANAGSGGRSLLEAVASIEAALTSSHAALTRFRAGLVASGYDATDAHLYSRRRRLRDPAVLIEVTDGVPRLTAEALAQIDKRFAADRISRVVYMIDVEGMGVPDGSDAFHSVLPPVLSGLSGA